MFGNTLGFFSSKIWRMSSNGQSGKQPLGGPLLGGQPLGGQLDQNPWNKLFHTSSRI